MPDPSAEEPLNTPEATLAPLACPTDDAREPVHDSRRSSVWIGIAFESGLGMIALVLAWCSGLSLLERIHFGLWPLLVYPAATIPLLMALGILLSTDWRMLRELRHFIDDFVLPLFVCARWWELAILCSAAGIGEELLFRGFLQPIFCGFLGLQLGVVLVNVLFGLMHPFSIAYLVLASLIGLYLSVLYVATDNLLAPIVVHGIYHFVALRWMMRRVLPVSLPEPICRT